MTDPRDQIPEPVRAFLMAFVHTFDELQVLLWLRRLEPETFDAARVHTELAMREDAALTALDALAERGLVRSETNASASFRYAPPAPLRALVSELAEAHARAPFALVEIMSNNALVRVRSSAIQTFGEALSLRRGPRK
jgi:hypothetical protein